MLHERCRKTMRKQARTNKRIRNTFQRRGNINPLYDVNGIDLTQFERMYAEANQTKWLRNVAEINKAKELVGYKFR